MSPVSHIPATRIALSVWLPHTPYIGLILAVPGRTILAAVTASPTLMHLLLLLAITCVSTQVPLYYLAMLLLQSIGIRQGRCWPHAVLFLMLAPTCTRTFRGPPVSASRTVAP